MSAPFSPANRRHHQLARRELELLLQELGTTGVASHARPDATEVLDTSPADSPAMRRFLGY